MAQLPAELLAIASRPAGFALGSTRDSCPVPLPNPVLIAHKRQQPQRLQLSQRRGGR